MMGKKVFENIKSNKHRRHSGNMIRKKNRKTDAHGMRKACILKKEQMLEAISWYVAEILYMSSGAIIKKDVSEKSEKH
jgi:hypothetical protein